jgi:hypothetical protein
MVSIHLDGALNAMNNIPDWYRSIAKEIRAAYRAGNNDLMTAKINEALERSQELSEAELAFLNYMGNTGRRSLDSNQMPPAYPDLTEYGFLSARSQLCHLQGKPEESLHHAWLFLQYCPAGTLMFQTALSALADRAAVCGDMMMARIVADMYLLHRSLLATALLHPETPVSWSAPAQASLQAWDPFGPMPVSAALKGIDEDGAHCWITILEMAADSMSGESFHENRYLRVLAALQHHYEQIGDTASLAKLQSDHPTDTYANRLVSPDLQD